MSRTSWTMSAEINPVTWFKKTNQMCRVALNWSCNSSHLHIIPLIRFPAVYKNAIYHATSKYTLSGESAIPMYIFYIFMHVFYILTHFFYQQQCSEINKVPGCQNLYPRWSAESCTNCTTIIVTRRHKYENFFEWMQSYDIKNHYQTTFRKALKKQACKPWSYTSWCPLYPFWSLFLLLFSWRLVA